MEEKEAKSLVERAAKFLGFGLVYFHLHDNNPPSIWFSQADAEGVERAVPIYEVKKDATGRYLEFVTWCCSTYWSLLKTLLHKDSCFMCLNWKYEKANPFQGLIVEEFCLKLDLLQPKDFEA